MAAVKTAKGAKRARIDAARANAGARSIPGEAPQTTRERLAGLRQAWLDACAFEDAAEEARSVAYAAYLAAMSGAEVIGRPAGQAP